MAALALLRRSPCGASLSSPKALILHRLAGFIVVIGASAHVALIAGTGLSILVLIATGILLLVVGAILPERRKLILVGLPAILAGMIAALAVGPSRKPGHKSGPIDRCTDCHGI